MSLLEAPAWLQAVLLAEAASVVWLTAKFGWRGLAASLAGGLVFWFLLGFGASWLVGRLEGGGATVFRDLLPGAALAVVRLAVVAAPLMGVAGLAGAALRHVRTVRKRLAP